jgi:hypothetical protein
LGVLTIVFARIFTSEPLLVTSGTEYTWGKEKG